MGPCAQGMHTSCNKACGSPSGCGAQSKLSERQQAQVDMSSDDVNSRSLFCSSWLRCLRVPEGPPMSGAMAARQRRERGALSAEDQKKADMLDRRQHVMNKWVREDGRERQRVVSKWVMGLVRERQERAACRDHLSAR